MKLKRQRYVFLIVTILSLFINSLCFDDTNLDDEPFAMKYSSMDDYWKKVKGEKTSQIGKTRYYYIGADEVEWDYAPDKINKITGKPFTAEERIFVESDVNQIGSVNLKCLYREYTDNSFTKLKPRPDNEKYLGFLGPLIRAEVGDTIKIMFRNGCRFPASMHPHGVFYAKDSEGAPYDDGTSGNDKADDSVPTNQKHEYTWLVPERAGPGPLDGSSIMWMYHSHTDENRDTQSGLVGAMIITAKGMARADGSPEDVDREFVVMFEIVNENITPFLNDNYRIYSKNPSVNGPPTSDPMFIESNLKHSINGYLYGNGPMMTMKTDERVRWYVMSMGNEKDLHTPHWHGNSLLIDGMRTDVASTLPAEMVVADMVPDNPGRWLFHCHVNDHIVVGMVTRYQVLRSFKSCYSS